MLTIIVGTRPEVIKMAPVYQELLKSDAIRPVILSTGQHREMLGQALGAFGLKANFDLELMQPGQTLPELTGRVINAVSGFIAEHKPAAILVQGDTTTVMAGVPLCPMTLAWASAQWVHTSLQIVPISSSRMATVRKQMHTVSV